MEALRRQSQTKNNLMCAGITSGIHGKELYYPRYAASTTEGMTPLFFALLARHEKVARTISRRISNLRSCLVDSMKRLTPLHVSCGLGLWSCATHFLNEGADVDATDASAMTPLHHALL